MPIPSSDKPHDFSVLSAALRHLGYKAMRFIGSGAEGVVIGLPGDRVAKFWTGGSMCSVDFFIEACSSIKCMPVCYYSSMSVVLGGVYVDPDGFKHRRMPLTIVEEIEHVGHLDAECGETLPPQVAVLRNAMKLVNDNKYETALALSGQKKLVRCLVKLHKMAWRFDYMGLGAQLGRTKDGRLVFYDLI